MARKRNELRIAMIAILSHIAFIAIWHLGVVITDTPSYLLPTPIAALKTLAEPNYNWLEHASVTAAEIFGGYLLAVLVGVALAVLFLWFGAVSAALMPLIVTINMIPKVAMAPLFIVWLSYGIVPNMVIAFTICFFPILLTTTRGLHEVEPDLIDLVRALKATRWQIFLKIQLPGSLPYLFSGMKVSAVLAVAGAIVGEFIASDAGLGYFLMIAQEALDTAAMVMALILITFIGTALYGLVVLLERLTVDQSQRVD